MGVNENSYSKQLRKNFVAALCVCVWLALLTGPLAAQTTNANTQQNPHQAPPQDIHIAVASNFHHTLNALISQYQAAYSPSGSATKPNFIVTSASSGALYQQIHYGAQYDIFFSADQHYPQQLQNNHAIIKTSRTTYAYGQLVLLHPKHRFENFAAFVQSLSETPYIIAIANPKTAPYGVAAKEVISSFEDENISAKQKFVYGNNIGQTLQFVHSGNADSGFIARSQLSLVATLKPTDYTIIPTKLYSPIRQDSVLLNRAKDNIAAQNFYRFISSNKAKKTLQNHGYQTHAKP